MRALLPGVMALSILFGTASMLAVTVTFEKKRRSFDRLLLAPIPLELLMLAKTSGAVFFGTLNAFVPVVMAALVADLSGVLWWQVFLAVVLIAVSSTFLGLFIAVSVSEVFEAQTFSNFFPFSDGLPLRALLSRRDASAPAEAPLLRDSLDLRGRRAPRCREPRRADAGRTELCSALGLLRGALPYQPSEHPKEWIA